MSDEWVTADKAHADEFIVYLLERGIEPDESTGVYQFFPAELRDLLTDYELWLKNKQGL